jgi:hypothetical protein
MSPPWALSLESARLGHGIRFGDWLRRRNIVNLAL